MARKPQATANKTAPAPASDADSGLSAAERAASRKVMKEATGTDSKALQNRLVNQTLASLRLGKGEDQDAAILATIAALCALAPSDALEGMLAAQMVATHEAAMECLRRAMIPEQTFEGRDANLKHAAKLTQVYARQMEALAKHRGQGQQKITVEHVNVHAGGQAIVGTVEAPTRPASRAAPAQRALPDATDNGVPLPDALTSPARTKQLARKNST